MYVYACVYVCIPMYIYIYMYIHIESFFSRFSALIDFRTCSHLLISLGSLLYLVIHIYLFCNSVTEHLTPHVVLFVTVHGFEHCDAD